MAKFTRFHPGMRLDAADLRNAAETSQLAVGSEVVEQLLLGEDLAGNAGLRVIGGFDVTGQGSGVISISRGSAILGFRGADGAAKFAFVTAGGDLVKSINVGSYSAAAYTIYVRFVVADTDSSNRIVWDAALGTPAEVVRNLVTRRSSDWEIAIEQQSPGDDWFEIATFTLAAGLVTVLTGTRKFLFEGREDASTPFLLEDADWGTSSDRGVGAANRLAFGVKSLTRFSTAILRQLQDIVGDRWFTNPKGGTTLGTGARSLTQLNSEKLAKNGDQAFTGTIGDVAGGALRPNVDNASSLGVSTKRWQSLFVWSIDAALNVVASSFKPSLAASSAINTLYQNNIVKCWGTVYNGGGGSSSFLLQTQFNVASVAFVNDLGFARWNITFTQPFATQQYSVVLTNMNEVGVASGINHTFQAPLDLATTTGFSVWVITTAAATRTLFTAADVTGFSFSFVILGVQ